MKKRILSLILALVMMFSLVQVTVSVSADIVTADGKYQIIDMTSVANGTTYGTPESDTSYTGWTTAVAPAYLSIYAEPNRAAVVLNRTAFNGFKDAQGLIYADDGVPFNFRTEEDTLNTINLGGSATTEINEAEVPVSGNFKSIDVVLISTGAISSYGGSSVTEVAEYNDDRTFKAEVHYTDGTVVTDPNLHGKFQGWVSNKNVNFTPGTGYAVPKSQFSQFDQMRTRLRITSATKVENYWDTPVPTYSIETIPAKTVAKVVFKSDTTKRCMISILAMTGVKVTDEEMMGFYFDEIPDVDDFNFASYMANKTAIDAALANVEALVADGGVLTAEQQAKYDSVKEKANQYTAQPAYGLKEAIEKLPEAEQINLDNYDEYEEEVTNLQEQLTEELKQALNEIDASSLPKLIAVAEKTVLYANTAAVINMVDLLPAPSDVTQLNYNKYTAQVEEIQALIEAGIDEDAAATAVTAFTAFNEKYVEMKEKAAQLSAETKTKYVTFDLTSVANGKNVTVQEPVNGKLDYSVGGYPLPEFLSPQANVANKPHMALNKKAWDELKACTEEGYIYADNGTPFNFRTELDNKNAINLGGLHWSANYKRTASIPVPAGRYKDIQLAIFASSSNESSTIVDYIGEALTVKVEYADGTVEELIDWKNKLAFSGPYSKANRAKLEQHLTGIGETFGAESRKVETTFDNTLAKTPNLGYDSNGNLYLDYDSDGKPYSAGMILPVYSIKVDPYKTVKSISVDYNCRAPLSIMAVTGVLPDNNDYYNILTGLMDQVTESSIKTVEGKKVSSEVRLLYDAYVGRTDATPLDAAYVEKYNWMVELLDNYSITVTKAEDFTNYTETTITIDFDNPIDKENAKNETKLTLDGTTLKEGKDYKLSATDTQIKLTVPNDYNYNKTYKVIINETLTDGQGKNFPLGVTYNYEFKPIAPFANNTYTIDGDKIKGINDEVFKGKTVSVVVDYVNGWDESQKFASVTGLFNKTTNTLIKCYYRQQELGAGETKTDTFSFDVPADDNVYELRTFNFNSFAELFDITKAVVK